MDGTKDSGRPVLSTSLVKLLTTPESVSSLLAKEPGLSPSAAWERLFGGQVPVDDEDESQQAGENEEKSKKRNVKSNGKGNWKDKLKDDAKVARKGGFKIESRLTTGGGLTAEEREKTLRCGRWGTGRVPSELFLTIYHDAVGPLQCDPAMAMVSPGLMGSSGTIPLTIISTVPDIVRHMSNLIVRAERDVILATNYWQNGAASKFLTNAMKELNRRAGDRGTRIVMKIMYDRASPKQLLEPHYLVSEKEWTGSAVGLPSRQEIPNIDLQVMNYHHPMLGTFHAKYMVVDRRIALVQSNNIQDNDNLEMMVHLEGPIVDSLYDMALISWYKKLDPPLPTFATPSASQSHGKAEAHRETDSGDNSNYESAKEAAERKTEDNMATPASGTRTIDQEGEPSFGESPIDKFLWASDSRMQRRQPPLTIESAAGLPEHTTDDPHYDADIVAEARRIQASVSPKPDEGRIEAVCRHLNHTTNVGFRPDEALVAVGEKGENIRPETTATAAASAASEEMIPYILSDNTEPFPIAMVCRPPHGAPNNSAAYTPQNVAWLSALRNARESVFIQSPTLNAEPLLPAIREACERGVDVICYICLGYNDAVSTALRAPGRGTQSLTLFLPTRASSSPCRAATTRW